MTTRARPWPLPLLLVAVALMLPLLPVIWLLSPGQARWWLLGGVALGLAQLGHDRVQAQLVDRGAVDAADERAGQPLDERTAEAAAEERPDRDVALVPRSGQDEVEPDPQLLQRREHRRRDERTEARREEQPDPLGQGHEPPARADLDGPRFARPDQCLAQPQLAAHARVESARAALAGVGFGADAEHRHRVPHGSEALAHRAADALRRAVGRAQRRVPGLQRLQLAKQRVVLGVGDLRRIEHVVAVVVVADQRAQLGGALLGLFGGLCGGVGRHGGNCRGRDSVARFGWAMTRRAKASARPRSTQGRHRRH